MTHSPILRIGTRSSRLALAQAKAVQESLRQLCSLESELVTIRTSGDRIQDRPLSEIGGKGLFAKELEEALLSKAIDAAVHSMKDLPVQSRSGLNIVATPLREDPRDAFLSPFAMHIADVKSGARIGTSSVRRAAQIARLREDVEIVPLRGNIDTRLAKLDEGRVDALILALAGLRRIGAAKRQLFILPCETWLPALSQGAIGVQMREGDALADRIAGGLDDETTAVTLACERGFQSALGGSCRSPIAGLASLNGKNLSFHGEVLAPDGRASVDARIEVQLGANARAHASEAGREAGLSLRERAQPWLT